MADQNRGGRLIAADTIARRAETMHFEDGNIVLNTSFDVEPVMLQAEFERLNWNGSFKGSRELGLLKGASIPMPIWMELRRTGILKDPAAFCRWIKAHPKFKTTEGNPFKCS